MVEGRCMRCKANREMVNTTEVTMSNGMRALKGQCKICKTKMFKILGKANGSSKSSTPTKRRRGKTGGKRSRKSSARSKGSRRSKH